MSAGDHDGRSEVDSEDIRRHLDSIRGALMECEDELNHDFENALVALEDAIGEARDLRDHMEEGNHD